VGSGREKGELILLVTRLHFAANVPTDREPGTG